MAIYTGTIHKGDKGPSSGRSVQNPTDLATTLDTLNKATVAAGNVTAAAAATAVALTGSLTGTLDNALSDVTFNSTWSNAQSDEIDKNFKEVQDEINALITDIALIRTAVNAILTALA